MHFYFSLNAFGLVHQVITWNYNKVKDVPTCSLKQKPKSNIVLNCATQIVSVWLKKSKKKKKCQVTLNKPAKLKQRHKTQDSSSYSSPSPSRGALVHTYNCRICSTRGSVKNGDSLKLSAHRYLEQIFLYNKSTHEFAASLWSVIIYFCFYCQHILTHHSSYFQKLLFVHLLVAINVEHFEGYIKSSARLCNNNVGQLCRQRVWEINNPEWSEPVSTISPVRAWTIGETYWSGWTAGTDTLCRISNLWEIKYTVLHFR